MATQQTVASHDIAWTDGRRLFWLLSPMVPVIGLVSLLITHFISIGLALVAVPVILYGVIPVLDFLIGTDRSNPPESVVPDLEDDPYYRAIVYAYIPIQYAATILGAWMVVSDPLAWWEVLLTIFTVGIVNGIGINTAHELGHKKQALERWLAKLTLAPVAYGHFFIEHNRGHHRRVATPEDPASSRMGEPFWLFLPRTVIGSARSAWQLEKERLERKGESVWSVHNDNLQAWAMTVILFAALAAVLGWWALLFLVVQAIYGFSLLEVVNYLEHYGLLRQYNEDSGRYERCAPKHSWNSNNVVTNLFLYQLQRHADHHANPTRRFQSLRHFDESPQLPSGYASMLLLAYIPPLWFRQINPLVAGHYNGDVSQANLYPPKRDKLIRRWQGYSADDGQPEKFPYAHREATSATATGTGGRYRCPDCGFVYDEAKGCPSEGFKPGTPWADVPQTWACPDCAVRDKPDFERL